MALDDQFYGADERTARLARVYDQEMDEPGELFVSDIVRFHELDERQDGVFKIRLLWDSLSRVLPLVIEVTEEDSEEFEVCVHRIRTDSADWRERFEHPWAF